MPVADLFVASGEVSLQSDEILTAIHIPSPPPGSRGVYLRFSLREAPDFALAAAAAGLTMDGERCKHALVTLLGVVRTPLSLPEAEKILEGSRLDDGVIEQAARAAASAARPLGDIFASATYRRKLVRTLVKRALETIRQEAAS